MKAIVMKKNFYWEVWLNKDDGDAVLLSSPITPEHTAFIVAEAVNFALDHICKGGSQ